MTIIDTQQENRVRRKLRQQGLRLQKSRARNERATTYSQYQISNPVTTMIEAGGGYTMNLDEVEAYADQT